MRPGIWQVMAVIILGFGLQVSAEEQALEVLQPAAGQQIHLDDEAGGEQRIEAVDASGAQEVGGVEPKSATQRTASSVAKFGVAVLGGAIALGTTAAMLLFL